MVSGDPDPADKVFRAPGPALTPRRAPIPTTAKVPTSTPHQNWKPGTRVATSLTAAAQRPTYDHVIHA